MFGIGSAEFLVILIVAFLVLGPSHLPKIARTLGKAMGEFRRVSTEFQRTLNLEVEKEEHEERKRQAEDSFFNREAQAEDADARPAEAATDVEKSVEATSRAANSAARSKEEA
ncbi:MAG: Sec-independent protein translocase protein TatB [Deltaproteobacteria bacterium]|jgi:sec-independent protein translocase protein TatB|nr:Sec-independent protein translocase protein TatB [Deltaproteobacteria bacterium]